MIVTIMKIIIKNKTMNNNNNKNDNQTLISFKSLKLKWRHGNGWADDHQNITQHFDLINQIQDIYIAKILIEQKNKLK